MLSACLLALTATAQTKTVKYGQLGQLPRRDAAMEKFRENRFGQFIHWGLFAIPAGQWNGKSYPGASEFLMKSANISAQEWAGLRHKFNPVQYDARQWAAEAKRLGVKYATITTKHHDGFSMWPSRYTDFDIESTPYKEDIIGQFVKAYNDEGIDVYLYYSILDWYHPDWRYRLETREDSVAFDRFKTFAENQLVELVERYPSVKGFWFDGTWDGSWKKSGQFSYELEKKLKELSPGLIVNSRMRADEYGARHFDSNGVLMGDYESGYERRLPSPYDEKIVKMDWESVMTIPENIWGYHADWKGHIKTEWELIEMLVRSVALNGNFLLNFGPTAEGTFRREETEIMHGIGKWMEKYGDAIYGCGYAGLKRQDWGYYTARKGSDTVNMVVFNVPVEKKLRVNVGKGMQVSAAEFMGSKGNIGIEKSVNGEFFLHLPKKDYREPFVIRIKVEPENGNGNHYMAPLI